MANNIGGAFTELKTKLEITDLQQGTVSTRQQKVRTAVEKDATLLDSFLIGSYKRHTMISPLSEADIDVFVVLPDNPYWNSYQHSPRQLLDDLCETLRKTYTKTPTINRNGQAVTITFSDFIVDVVPAFLHDHGGYLIPDDENHRWLRTDPTVHTSVISLANTANSGMLVPLIKMIKQWNKHHSMQFRSFYLELLAVEAFSFVGITSYQQAFKHFIEHASASLGNGLSDPAGHEGYIKEFDKGDYLSCASMLHNTSNVIGLAERYEYNGDLHNASKQWRRVFGGYFPEIR